MATLTLSPLVPVSSKWSAEIDRIQLTCTSDDGSGTIGVLRVAEALSHYKIKNAVRFAFWGAEEFGKLGSYYYIKQLNTSDVEIAKMRAYLNFDMVSLDA